MPDIFMQYAWHIFDKETLESYVRAVMQKASELQTVTVGQVFDCARLPVPHFSNKTTTDRNTYSVGKMARGSFGNTLVELGYDTEGAVLLKFLEEKPKDEEVMRRNAEMLRAYSRGNL